MTEPRARLAAALSVLVVGFSRLAYADADSPRPSTPPPVRTGSEALLFEVSSGWVPFANDVPLMVGIGVRIAHIHEIGIRAGYMPTGDDTGYGFGVVGYRAVLRPHHVFRPILGVLSAGLPATCSHLNHPECTNTALFIFAAVGGIRIEPVPWLGLSAVVSLGTDTYPNPFGMLELGATFALPLS